jgi:hypothetical protein
MPTWQPGGLLAHPLTEHGVLPVAPALIGLLAGAAVAILTIVWPSGRVTAPPHQESADRDRTARRSTHIDSWEAALSRPQMVARASAVGLLLLAVVAGRLGSERELENLAPALVVGVGWPALIALSLVLGPAWRWLDPWDAVARVLDRGGSGGAAEDARLAAIPALAWTWYLGVYPSALAPRSVGFALGAYSIVTVGGCLAFGRAGWLSRAEVFGLFFGWVARLPRGLLRGWSPPRGTALLLGALAGGLLFGELRRTEVWGELNVVPGALAWATGALVGCAAAAGLILTSLERGARNTGGGGEVLAAAVPAVAAIGLAVAMARSRLFTSMQILPFVLADPFGRGWDLWTEPSVEMPLSPSRLAILQIVILLAGHLAGAWVLARRRPPSRTPAAVALAVLMAAATTTLTLASGL